MHRPLGTTSIRVSPIGLGTVKLGRNIGVKYPRPFDLPSDDEALALLRRVADLDINLIDTAPAYGTSESRLGALLHKLDWLGSRERWILSTKAGEEFENAESSFDFSAAAIEASVHRSLARLRTDYLDIVLIHSDGNDVHILSQTDALPTLQHLKQRGVSRAVGISTKTPDGALLAVDSGCDVVMLTLNPGAAADLPAIRAASQRGVGILIKKAFSSGHAALPANAPQHADPIRAALDFVYQTGGAGVSSVVAGTINPDHLAHNVQAANEALAALTEK